MRANVIRYFPLSVGFSTVITATLFIRTGLELRLKPDGAPSMQTVCRAPSLLECLIWLLSRTRDNYSPDEIPLDTNEA